MRRHVLLVADHGLIRADIRALIDQSGESRVAAEPEELSGALHAVKRPRPELVVVEVGMPWHGDTAIRSGEFLEKLLNILGAYEPVLRVAVTAYAHATSVTKTATGLP